ncbi:helix-turn-helix transcriptional regulator [Singulisphaera sp. Ch08]|uniref:Helix-turn-helix transcriptional regulator n=1 Tax=Singulisphaera sp. Ch08 TaxID=3120278 RepID=A0AAU7C891_9BACT
MNQIERIREALTKRFPGMPMNLDEPANEKWPWFLFVPRGDGLRPLAIEWRPDRGFGVSTPSDDEFGMGPDEVYAKPDEALERAAVLIQTGENSQPPLEVQLADLRRQLGISQAQLGELAGVGQANISRIERRGDVLVSTLTKVINAMGGELAIHVRFPGREPQKLDLIAPANDEKESEMPRQGRLRA